VFKSNSGDFDTIFVKEITKGKVEDDPLAVNPNYYEQLDVIVRHSDPTWGVHRYLENSFLGLSAAGDGNTIISFDLAAKKSWFYADSYYKNDLNKCPTQTLQGKNWEFNDVIKLQPQSQKYFERDEFITAAYWSKSKGYIRYDLKNGVFWELQ